MSDGMGLLTTLGEAGGITGMVALVLGLLIRMVKKNGCTLKCYWCTGKPAVEVDCEEGAATKRYAIKEAEDTPVASENE